MKVFCLSSLFFIFFLSAYAQKTRITISGRPQLIWLSSGSDKVTSDGVMTGISSVLESDFFFTEKYAVSLGISLDNIGGRISYSDTILFSVLGEKKEIPAATTFRYRMQYLGIPLGLKLKTMEIGYTTFFLNPGITPMVNVKSRIYDAIVFPDKSNAKDEIKLLNLNYFVSAGFEYSLGGSTSLVGGLGYTAGFFDVTKRDNDKVKTRSFFLKAGILF